jgi:hypothetical protein
MLIKLGSQSNRFVEAYKEIYDKRIELKRRGEEIRKEIAKIERVLNE